MLKWHNWRRDNFEEWTRMKQRNVLEVPSGNSKAYNVNGRRKRLGKPCPSPHTQKKNISNKNYVKFVYSQAKCRSQWSLSLRRRSAAARLLVLRVRIPSGTWKFVYYECCVLSGRGLGVGLITRAKQSYQLWWVCLSVVSERLHSGDLGPLGVVARWNEHVKSVN